MYSKYLIMKSQEVVRGSSKAYEQDIPKTYAMI